MSEPNDIDAACVNMVAAMPCEKPVASNPGEFWCPFNWPDYALVWCLPCLARMRNAMRENNGDPA